MKLKRWIGLVMVGAIIAILVGACAPAPTPPPAAAPTPTPPPVIKWRMASSWPKGTYLQWAADEFAKRVEEMSGGRLVIESYPGGAIVGALEVFDAVNAGTIEASHSWAGYWIGKEPACPFFAALPMGFEAVPFLTWIYEGGGLELWKEMYAEYNFGFVGPAGCLPPEDFAWAHKPLRTLEDFKGLKIRGVGFWGEILKEIGASVVTLPGAEVYPALERKVVDAAEYSLPNIDWDLGFHEVCKYLHVPGIHQPSSLLELIINKDAWEALPKDLQEIVKGASREVTLRSLLRGFCLDAEALRRFREYGTEIIYIDPKLQKEFRRRAEALYDRLAAKDPFFAKVLKSQREFREKYEEYKKLMTPVYE